MQIINEASDFGPVAEVKLTSDQITLSPFAIAVVHMSNLNALTVSDKSDIYQNQFLWLNEKRN
jgi:hypothetical protein